MQPLNVSEIRFSSMDAFLHHIGQRSAAPKGVTPEFLYRGMPARYLRKWPPLDEPSLPRDSYCYDSMIPSDYRGAEDHIRSTGSKANLPSRFSTETARWRGRISLDRLLTEATKHKADASVDDWVKGLLGHEHPLTYSAGVAEHCAVFPTHLLNLTSDLNVALWFATHNFGTGHYAGPVRAFVYELKRQPLVDVITKLPSSVHLVDLRDTPEKITRRPGNQHGWVLAGSESPTWLETLVKHGDILLYSFPPNSTYLNYPDSAHMCCVDPVIGEFEKVKNTHWQALDKSSWDGIFGVGVWGQPIDWKAVFP